MTDAKTAAAEICEHLKLPYRWPDPEFRWLEYMIDGSFVAKEKLADHDAALAAAVRQQCEQVLKSSERDWDVEIVRQGTIAERDAYWTAKLIGGKEGTLLHPDDATTFVERIRLEARLETTNKFWNALHVGTHSLDCRFTGCTCGSAAKFREQYDELSRERAELEAALEKVK